MHRKDFSCKFEENSLSENKSSSQQFSPNDEKLSQSTRLTARTADADQNKEAWLEEKCSDSNDLSVWSEKNIRKSDCESDRQEFRRKSHQMGEEVAGQSRFLKRKTSPLYHESDLGKNSQVKNSRDDFGQQRQERQSKERVYSKQILNRLKKSKINSKSIESTGGSSEDSRLSRESAISQNKIQQNSHQLMLNCQRSPHKEQLSHIKSTDEEVEFLASIPSCKNSIEGQKTSKYQQSKSGIPLPQKSKICSPKKQPQKHSHFEKIENLCQVNEQQANRKSLKRTKTEYFEKESVVAFGSTEYTFHNQMISSSSMRLNNNSECGFKQTENPQTSISELSETIKDLELKNKQTLKRNKWMHEEVEMLLQKNQSSAKEVSKLKGKLKKAEQQISKYEEQLSEEKGKNFIEAKRQRLQIDREIVHSVYEPDFSIEESNLLENYEEETGITAELQQKYKAEQQKSKHLEEKIAVIEKERREQQVEFSQKLSDLESDFLRREISSLEELAQLELQNEKYRLEIKRFETEEKKQLILQTSYRKNHLKNSPNFQEGFNQKQFEAHLFECNPLQNLERVPTEGQSKEQTLQSENSSLREFIVKLMDSYKYTKIENRILLKLKQEVKTLEREKKILKDERDTFKKKVLQIAKIQQQKQFSDFMDESERSCDSSLLELSLISQIDHTL